jgi:aldose 1-epimerase
MITLHDAAVRCEVDPERGARLASLEVLGRELLWAGEAHGDPLRGGCYPMVPWAGRLRRGRVSIAGRVHQVTGVGRHGDHPLHGTVADRPWTVISHDATHVRCRIDLGDRWPCEGIVEHLVTLDEYGVTCTLTLATADTAFPAQVGWHPWFTAPWRREVGFHSHYPRGADMLPVGVVEPWPGDPLGNEAFDDCFWGPRWIPRLIHPDGSVIEVSSDCGHWVIYDEPGTAVCLEPQSGPPDGATIDGVVVPPGASLQRWMRIAPGLAERSVTVQ